MSQWYFHDLDWWGLDYPPLTAYHSWVLGKVGALINPTWFALHTSRGLEDDMLKIYMRATVIVSEYLIYVPAVIIFVRRYSRAYGVHSWDASVALLAILMQPATILIDHVHFQYNTVMLGFVLASMSSMMAGRFLWACVFFVAALGFKQMALYYAPAIFAYLLGVCLFPRLNIVRLISIATVTLASFAILLLPLYLGALYDSHRGIDARPELQGFPAPLPFIGAASYKLDATAWYYPLVQQTAQLIFRIFPFSRGLFEDKVANFWCALNVAIKLRVYDQEILQRASLIATLIAIAPPCIVIFFKPKRELVPLALASTAWAFFLFSFQVHEKSVLIPLMPMTALLASKRGLSKYSRSWIGFANMLGVWTLFPLLQRVELRIPYFVLTLLWSYLLGLPPVDWSSYEVEGKNTWHGIFTTLIHSLFYIPMVLWHFLEAFVTPPSTLPDLWVVINVGIGAAGFGLCYLWCVGTLVTESGIFASAAVEKRADAIVKKKTS